MERGSGNWICVFEQQQQDVKGKEEEASQEIRKLNSLKAAVEIGYKTKGWSN